MMLFAPEGWSKLRWQSPWVATRVSGSTRMGRVRIRVRTIRREEVITVIVRFIRWRLEGKADCKEMGAKRVRRRDRRATTLSSPSSSSHFNFQTTGRERRKATRTTKARSAML